jgi:uncharacterized protein YydD (DUF2326 family)
MDFGTVITVAAIVGSATFWLGSELKGIERDIGELKGSVRELIDFLITLVDNLGRKRILEDVDLLKTALKSMVSNAANPLTAEERRRLLELIDRGEDLTPEEADELLSLAKKFYNEYAGKVQDAWKMLYYAAAIHGIVHGRYERKATPPNPNP